MATGLNFSDSYRELKYVCIKELIMYFLDNAEERAKYIGALSILDAVAERIVDGIFNHFVHVDIRATGHTN